MNTRKRGRSLILPLASGLAAAALLFVYWQWLERAGGPAADLALPLDARIHPTTCGLARNWPARRFCSC